MAIIVPKIELHQIHFISKQNELVESFIEFINEWNNDAPTFRVKTSGSTGIPHEIELNKSYALASAHLTGNFFQYQSNDYLVSGLSPKTIGVKMQFIRAALFGMKIIVCDTNRNPLRDINRQVKQISVVPLQLREIIEKTPEKLHFVDTFLVGGSVINNDLKKLILSHRIEVYESYGMTETYSHVALRKIQANKPYFKALQGITFSSINDQLCIHAAHLGHPQMLTNDLVNLVDSTNFEWLGRADFAINSGGKKFIPEQLESKLIGTMNHAFFIFGEKNELFGEIVTLFIEAYYSAELQKNIEEICNKLLDRYEIPKKIYFVPIFNLTKNGKLDRLNTQKKVIES